MPCTSEQVGCGPGLYRIGCGNGNLGDCVDCNVSCPAGEYIIAPCNGFKDIECARCSPPFSCGPNEYQSAPCIEGHNRICSDCDHPDNYCPAGQLRAFWGFSYDYFPLPLLQ
eukprot:95466-Hanusia_phi.AAC.12